MYSGRFVLRLNPSLHQSLSREAKANGMSLNQWIANTLEATAGGKESHQFKIIKDVFGRELEGVVMFGSQVRGEAKESSDIDLLIVLKSESKINRARYKIWQEKVEPVLGEKFSPQIVSLPQNPMDVGSLWLEASNEGEILLECGPRLRKVIYEIKGLISLGHFLRKKSYGQPYWVRKNDAK